MENALEKQSVFVIISEIPSKPLITQDLKKRPERDSINQLVFNQCVFVSGDFRVTPNFAFLREELQFAVFGQRGRPDSAPVSASNFAFYRFGEIPGKEIWRKTPLPPSGKCSRPVQGREPGRPGRAGRPGVAGLGRPPGQETPWSVKFQRPWPGVSLRADWLASRARGCQRRQPLSESGPPRRKAPRVRRLPREQIRTREATPLPPRGARQVRARYAAKGDDNRDRAGRTKLLSRFASGHTLLR